MKWPACKVKIVREWPNKLIFKLKVDMKGGKPILCGTKQNDPVWWCSRVGSFLLRCQTFLTKINKALLIKLRVNQRPENKKCIGRNFWIEIFSLSCLFVCRYFLFVIKNTQPFIAQLIGPKFCDGLIINIQYPKYRLF